MRSVYNPAMQTYGNKWRANSSACAKRHVSRSVPPLLRLDSTGDISSVDHKFPSGRTYRSSHTDMNCNPCKMKWVTNRVTSLNGLTGSQKKIDVVDSNGNMFDYITGDIMNGTISHSMNSRGQKFIQPQCGFSGWNYNGQQFGQSGAQTFPVFPCHQFSNSFNNSYCKGLFNQTDVMRPFISGPMCQNNQMVDPRWHKYQKGDRSRRGQSPKHHKSVHRKQAKSSVPGEPEQLSSVSETDKIAQSSLQCNSFSKDTTDNSETLENTQTDISKLSRRVLDDIVNMGFDIRSQDQVVPDQNGSSILGVNKNNSGCKQKVHEPKRDSDTPQGTRKVNICHGEKKGENVKDSDISKTGILNSSSHDMDASLDSSTLDPNVHVLFVRKNWKKGRPSASKQRRRKLQKAKSASSLEMPLRVNADTSSACDNERGTENTESCSASVSFILGLAQSSSPKGATNAANFILSFSDDEDDDSVDGEWNPDLDFGHIEAEFSQCDLLSFLPNSCNTPSNPISFKVHISPLEVSPNQGDKCLDKINQAWNVQLSVEDDSSVSKKSKKSTKKVRFAEDKDLLEVHHMFAWSYAYRAARKCYWENYVRDRDRFNRRIQDIEEILLPILSVKHREDVYEKLYKSNTSDLEQSL